MEEHLKIIRGAALTLALISLYALPASAQRADGIAAVVNDDVVLESDVEEQLYIFMQSLAANARPDSAQVDTLRKQFLNQLIDDKLIVGEAKRQGISITDAELNKQTEAAVAEVKARFKTEAAFQAQLRAENTTLEKLREKLRGDVQRRTLAGRLIEKQFPRKPVPQSEAEVYFKANVAKFPRMPAEVKVAVIQIPVEADTVAIMNGKTAALAARKRIAGGEKFAKVAAEVSDDPGSARSGGDLGFFAEGTLEPALEKVAFQQPLNRLSEPVRTPYGWHLVETLERDTVKTAAGRDSLGEDGKPVREAHARHILIRVALGEQDVARARAVADRVRGEAVKGTNFGTLARRYSRYDGPANADGELGFISTRTLQDPIRNGLDSLEVGQVSEVMPNQAGFNIFKLLDRKPEREYTLEEVRAELPQVVAEMKARDRYDDWIKTLRAKANVQIR